MPTIIYSQSTAPTVIDHPQGPPGLQGKSAYQSWLDAGHTGTEQDFLDWLAAAGGFAPSDAAPLDLAAAASPGAASLFSRADHQHKLPTPADIGADAAGAATSAASSAVAAHTAAADPHPQYLKESDAATVATTGAYADLSGKPTLGTAASHDVGDFDAVGAAAAAQSAAQSYADNAVSSAVVGLLDDRGSYDASGNVFPSTGGSGAGGAVRKGDLWTVSVAGALGGVAVTAGDVVRALVDAPGQTASNWAVTENNIGYVPEPAQTLVTQAEAEAGTDTNRKAWSVLRVWQAIAAWWAGSSAKTKLDGIAAGATANATDAQLRDRATHTGTQSYSTITGLGGAATLNVGTTSGTVAAGDDARLSDARTPTAHTHPLSDLTQSGATTNQVPQWDGSAWVPATVSGGGGSPSVRSASGSAGGGSTYVYMGNAANGTLDSAGAWTITRLTVDGGGGLTATTHATSNPSSVWNDYASLTYT